jgi:hypothetical protein
MIIPEKIYIYRLTHIENLDYILTKNHVIIIASMWFG